MGLHYLISLSTGTDKGIRFLTQKPQQGGTYLLLQDLNALVRAFFFFLRVFQKILLLFPSAKMGQNILM